MHSPLENNPIRHTQKIKAQMRQFINHLLDDIGKVKEAQTQALRDFGGRAGPLGQRF